MVKFVLKRWSALSVVNDSSQTRGSVFNLLKPSEHITMQRDQPQIFILVSEISQVAVRNLMTTVLNTE